MNSPYVPVDGRAYFDFLSAYSAVNQGHCHPKIVEAFTQQASTLTLSSRAFYNDCLAELEVKMTDMFHFNKVLPMNTGAEAFETACKLSRRWAYRVKGVKRGEARLCFMSGNFHGRTMMAVSASDDPSSRTDFGPYFANLDVVAFGSADDLEAHFQEHAGNTAALVFEPIQGEAGINVPPPGWLAKVRELCTKYNVLMVADEIQTGLCRTGTMLRVDSENVKPDMVILGKALSGGTYPVSAVLADDEVMNTLEPGSHGSTFGGNPLAAKIGVASLQVLEEERLAERAFALGEIFRNELRCHLPEDIIVRGAGLLNAVVVKPTMSPLLGRQAEAYDVCLRLMKEHGVLCKPTHRDVIRLAPPLVIPRQDLEQVARNIGESVNAIFKQ